MRNPGSADARECAGGAGGRDQRDGGRDGAQLGRAGCREPDSCRLSAGLFQATLSLVELRCFVSPVRLLRPRVPAALPSLPASRIRIPLLCCCYSRPRSGTEATVPTHSQSATSEAITIRLRRQAKAAAALAPAREVPDRRMPLRSVFLPDLRCSSHKKSSPCANQQRASLAAHHGV